VTAPLKTTSVEFNSIVAQQKKAELLESMSSIQEAKEFFCKVLEEIGSTERDIKAQKESVIGTIETCFKELAKIVDTRKLELVGEAEENARKRLEGLILRRKKLSSSCDKADHVMAYTRQCLEYCSDDEVMNVHAEMLILCSR